MYWALWDPNNTNAHFLIVKEMDDEVGGLDVAGWWWDYDNRDWLYGDSAKVLIKQTNRYPSSEKLQKLIRAIWEKEV